MEKLMKCPFCGGEAKMHSHIVFENRGEDYRKHWNGDKFHVKCESCGIRTRDYYTGPEAAADWNRRQQDLKQENAALCEQLAKEQQCAALYLEEAVQRGSTIREKEKQLARVTAERDAAIRRCEKSS